MHHYSTRNGPPLEIYCKIIRCDDCGRPLEFDTLDFMKIGENEMTFKETPQENGNKGIKHQCIVCWTKPPVIPNRIIELDPNQKPLRELIPEYASL